MDDSFILIVILILSCFVFIVLMQPLFPNIAINEGELLRVVCVSMNIPDITTLEIFDPNGMPVMAVVGVYNVPSVTRAFAGTYTCVIRSALDNSNVTETSTVIIQCKLSILDHYFFSIGNNNGEFRISLSHLYHAFDMQMLRK